MFERVHLIADARFILANHVYLDLEPKVLVTYRDQITSEWHRKIFTGEDDRSFFEGMPGNSEILVSSFHMVDNEFLPGNGAPE